MSYLEKKYNQLQKMVREMESALVAFSGGVDSTFLLKVAFDTLGEKVLAVTANSEVQPESEIREAEDIIKDIGARHMIIETGEMEDGSYVSNSFDRCYHCIGAIFC